MGTIRVYHGLSLRVHVLLGYCQFVGIFVFEAVLARLNWIATTILPRTNHFVDQLGIFSVSHICVSHGFGFGFKTDSLPSEPASLHSETYSP